MPARIRSEIDPLGGVAWATAVNELSRDDLRRGYSVRLTSLDVAAVSYSWAIAFTPDSAGPNDGSAADFTGTASLAALAPDSIHQIATFNVDNDGSYLIRLVIDAGEPTESTQFVRLRALTKFANLKLPSAGERRDGTGIIPIDADATGWTDDLNQNFLRLAAFIRRTATSGRVLYVDANRGRDNTKTVNDPTNVIHFPGTDAANLNETGIRAKAERFADFSSIQAAITYAVTTLPGYAQHAEPAPSAANPFIIVVKPGLYVENVAFVPFVYVVADQSVDKPTTGGVVVRSINATNHTYTSTDPTFYTLLQGLTFENANGAANDPVLVQSGGILELVQCTLTQRKVTAANKSAFTIDGTIHPATARLTDCTVTTAATAITSFAISTIGTGLVDLTLTRCQVTGPSAIEANRDDVDNHSIQIYYSTLSTNAGADPSGYGILGEPVFLVIRGSTIEKTGIAGTLESILMDFTGIAPATLTVNIQDTSIVHGDVSVDPTSVAGTKIFVVNNLQIEDGAIVFPSGPGTIPTVKTFALGKSIFYDPQWTRPEDNNSPTPIVPATNKIPPAAVTSDVSVQDAIDFLTNALFMVTSGAPFYSLDTVYDGIAAPLTNPPTPGAGLGRLIHADAGAVKIDGADAPVQSNDTSLKGGIQVEGVGDFGPMVSDGFGSEINLRPAYGANLAGEPADGCGPFISLGRSLIPINGDVITHRGLPAAVIQAGNPGDGTAAFDAAPYNMIIRTRNRVEASTGEAGRIVIEGGTIPRDDNAVKGGSVYIQGGSNFNTVVGNAIPGDVFLAPGFSVHATDPTGHVRIAKTNGTTTFTTLVAGGAYAAPGASAGNFWIATPHGVEKFAIGAGDVFATVVATINNNSLMLFASDAGGSTLQIECLMPGPNGDVIFLGDSNAGALNRKLGNLSQSALAGPLVAAATLTPGVYGKTVALTCTDTEELTIGTDPATAIIINGTTGKLTVPGIIDPIGLVLTETATADVPTGAGKGALFISDGTDAGSVLNHLYYKDAAGAPVDLSLAGGASFADTGSGGVGYAIITGATPGGEDLVIGGRHYTVALAANAGAAAVAIVAQIMLDGSRFVNAYTANVGGNTTATVIFVGINLAAAVTLSETVTNLTVSAANTTLNQVAGVKMSHAGRYTVTGADVTNLLATTHPFIVVGSFISATAPELVLLTCSSTTATFAYAVKSLATVEYAAVGVPAAGPVAYALILRDPGAVLVTGDRIDFLIVG